MKTLVKLRPDGASVVATIPRRVLNYLRWQSGDVVVLELRENLSLTMRNAQPMDLRNEPPAAVAAFLPKTGAK